MYPRPGVSLVPNCLCSLFLEERIPKWLPLRWTDCPSRLADLGPAIWDNLEASEVDDVSASVLAIVQKRVRKWRSVPTLIPSESMLRRFDGLLDNRTANALTRAFSQNLSLDSIGALMRIPNFGAHCLLDYLSAIESVEAQDPLSLPTHIPNESEAARTRATYRERSTSSEYFALKSIVTRKPVRHRVSSLAPLRYTAWSPALGIMLAVGVVTGADRLILVERTLSRHPKTLQELATKLNVTRERIRQREVKTLRAIRSRLSSPANSEVRRALADLRLALALDVHSLDKIERSTRREFGFPAHFILNETVFGVVKILLGFEFDDGTFAYRKPPDSMRGDVTQALSEGFAANDEDLVLSSVAHSLNVSRAFVASVRTRTDLRQIGDQLLPWRGSLGDKAERILADLGRPVTFDELCQLLELTVGSRATLRNYINGETRFQKVTKSHIALASWQMDPFSTIQDAIVARIRSSDGSVLLDDLIRELPPKYHFAESSLRSNLTHPRFKVDNLGFVSEVVNTGRAPDESVDPSKNRLLFRHENIWYLRIRITPELIKGSGSAISISTASFLGLKPGVSINKLISNLPIVFRWSGMQPSVSSIRSLINLHNATSGDFLFIDVSSASGSASSFIRSTADIDDAIKLLLLLSGNRPSFGSTTEAVSRICNSLGAPPAAPATIDILRLYFSGRRDDQALDLIAGAKLEISRPLLTVETAREISQ
jgi:hypothetical protein